MLGLFLLSMIHFRLFKVLPGMSHSLRDNRHMEIIADSSRLVSSLEELFYADSNEKNILREKISHILAGNRYQDAIDIGAGPGLVSEVLNNHAERLTLLEIMPEYYQALKDKFPDAQIKIESILDFEFHRNYDLILLSHVLYYISTSEWERILKKLYFHLRPGGKLIVIHCPCHRIHQIFKRTIDTPSKIAYLNEEALTKVLKNVGPYTQDFYLSHSYHPGQKNYLFAKKFVETFFAIDDVSYLNLQTEFDELLSMFKLFKNKLEIEYCSYLYIFEK